MLIRMLMPIAELMAALLISQITFCQGDFWESFTRSKVPALEMTMIKKRIGSGGC
jgi:hypothetical protein